MSIDTQALIAKIKKQTESFDTVVLKEDEANALVEAMEAAEKRIAELIAPDCNAIAWESTTPVYIKFITDERYRRLRPGYQKWYKPYRCSNCAAGITVKGE